MSKITFAGLQKFNLVMAGLHFAQALLVVLFSKDFRLPVNGTYLALDSSTQTLQPVTTTFFDMPFVWLIAGFFLLSSVAHLTIATVYNAHYVADLKKGMNRARWIEYSVSASVMIVAISMLVGVYDGMSLFMLFTLTALMNLLGLVMETHNQGAKKPNWTSYWLGCIAGAVPWVVIAFMLWLGAANGSAAPGFVYGIFVSIFLFFNCFAINMVLQYKKIGPWKDYLFGERAYIILSLVAKSLLAWQVFGGTLRP